MKGKGIVAGVIVIVVAAIFVFAFFWERDEPGVPDFDVTVRSFACIDNNATFSVEIWNNGTAVGDARVRYTVWNGTAGGVMLVNETITYLSVHRTNIGDPIPPPFNATATFEIAEGPFGQQGCNADIMHAARLV